MFGINFINPVLLLGIIGVAIPVVIHLLNRYKFKTVEWAAMEFLIEAFKKNYRRLRLENILLLIVRICLILFFVILISRPYFQGLKMLSGLSYHSPRLYIIILDDSPSMGQKTSVTSSWETGAKAVQMLCEAISKENSGDRFTLIRSSSLFSPDFYEILLSKENQQAIASHLSTVSPSDISFDLVSIFSNFPKWVSMAKKEEVFLYIITDCRRYDWDRITKQEGAKFVSLPDSGKIHINILDVGFPDPQNIGITGLECIPSKVIAGLGARIQLRVKNFGDRSAEEVYARLKVGDKELPQNKINILGPGEEGVISFNYPFIEKGSYSMEARISSDALISDNIYYSVVDAKEQIGALLIDGEPSSGIGGIGETFFLQRALDPVSDGSSGVKVTMFTESAFGGSLSFEKYDVVFLANLFHFPSDRLEDLREFVANGGGLVIFLGNRVNVKLYNQEIYQDGKGLLPLPLIEILTLRPGEGSKPPLVHFYPEKEEHPILKIFQGDNNPFLKQVNIYTAISAQKDRLSHGGRVLASYSDIEKNPAIIEKPYGKGKVILFTTSCDTDWNDWPKDPSFLVLCQQTVSYLVEKKELPRVFPLCAPIVFSMDPSTYHPELHLLMPGAKEQGIPITAVPTEHKGFYVEWSDTRKAGFYTFYLKDRNTGHICPYVYATNINHEEGDLHKINKQMLIEAFKGFEINYHYVPDGKIEALQNEKKEKERPEIWPYLARFLLFLVILESILAWSFGTARNI